MNQTETFISQFDKIKQQVQNHEALIVMRCSIVLMDYSESDSMPMLILFERVQKQINMFCYDVFKNVLMKKDKVFGSTDTWESVFLQPGRTSLLQELLTLCPNTVPKIENMTSFYKTKATHQFEVKTNKNSLDFLNVFGRYYASDNTFVPKFQRKNHHHGVSCSVPSNMRLKDGDWMLVSLRFAKKADFQFSCEVHNVVPITSSDTKTVKESSYIPETNMKENVLLHNLFAHLLGSTSQQMRISQMRQYVRNELQHEKSEASLLQLLSSHHDLFQIKKETNKTFISLRKKSFKEKGRFIQAYLALGNNVTVSKIPTSEDIPISIAAEIIVKKSKTETNVMVNNLIGIVIPATNMKSCKVSFRLRDNSTISIPCIQGSFHNSRSKSGTVTFNLQKKLHTKDTGYLTFGIVPGKHKEHSNIPSPQLTSVQHQLKGELQHEKLDKLALLPMKPELSTNIFEEVLTTKLVFALLAKPPNFLPYNVTKLLGEVFDKSEVQQALQLLTESKVLSVEGENVTFSTGCLKNFLMLGSNMRSLGRNDQECKQLNIPLADNITVETMKTSKRNKIMKIQHIPALLHGQQDSSKKEETNVYMRFSSDPNVVLCTQCPTHTLKGNKGTINLSVDYMQVIKKSIIKFTIENGKSVGQKKSEKLQKLSKRYNKDGSSESLEEYGIRIDNNEACDGVFNYEHEEDDGLQDLEEAFLSSFSDIIVTIGDQEDETPVTA